MRLSFDRSTTHYRNPIARLQLNTSSNTVIHQLDSCLIEAGGLYEIAAGPARRARSRRSMGW